MRTYIDPREHLAKQLLNKANSFMTKEHSRLCRKGIDHDKAMMIVKRDVGPTVAKQLEKALHDLGAPLDVSVSVNFG